MVDNPHIGSSLDDFLADEGILEEVQAIAIKEVLAWQLAQAMQERRMSRRSLAAQMKTSRTQVDRLLDPAGGNVTLETLQRAAAVLGRRLELSLV